MSTAEELKRRVVPLTEPVPSFADSICSSSEESEEDVVIVQDNSTIKSKQLERRRSSISNVVNSTFLRKRLSRQSSLPWGHRRSKLIGISCFLFLLPIPLLLKSCCPFAAFMLAVVTVSSFSSDYVYTGVESRSHLLDRALAPVALVSLHHMITYFCRYYTANHSLYSPSSQDCQHICNLWAVRTNLASAFRDRC